MDTLSSWEIQTQGDGSGKCKVLPPFRHLHGLWMKCSGSGIPGERGPCVSHTPCDIPNFQVSPLFHTRSILIPMFPASSPPPPLYHHPHKSRHILQLSHLRGGTHTLRIFRNSEASGRGVVPLTISSNKLTWHQVKSTQHGTHKHPQRACWNPIPRLGWKTL